MPNLDTFQSIVGDVHAHAQGVDSLLIEGWTRDTWLEIQRLRTWSHLRRAYQIVIPAPYSTGTAALTPGSDEVVLTGATVSNDWIGRQFQRASGEPIHEIYNVDTAASKVYIRPEWNYTTSAVTGQGYKVFVCYVVPPQDFFAWLTVRDVERRHRLSVRVTQDMIDRNDPQRSLGTRPACLAGLDWTRNYNGRVFTTLLITLAGASPTPVASGAYNGQSDAVLVLRITGTGAVDTATFSYALDDATPVTLTTSSSGNQLPSGVELSWPAGTYTSGTVYVVRLSSNPVVGLPRYELYPHPREAMVLPVLYAARPTDIEADDWVLPAPFTGDIIALGTKSEMARYPGTRDKPNPYAQIGRAQEFRDRFEEAVMQCMTLDEYIIGQNVFEAEEWPYALMPWPWSRTDDVRGMLL